MRSQPASDLHLEHLDAVSPHGCTFSPLDDYGIRAALNDEVWVSPFDGFGYLTPTDEFLDTSAHGVFENRHTALQRICEQP